MKPHLWLRVTRLPSGYLIWWIEQEGERITLRCVESATAIKQAAMTARELA